MVEDKLTLIERLRRAGFSRAAINAAWPSWWTDEAEASPSGRAELRFALARRLGLDPKPLLGERVEFIWNDEAKFKNLSSGSDLEKAAITSFGVSIGRLLLRATPLSEAPLVSAEALRAAIIGSGQIVSLGSLVGTCWALGIPVIYLRVFPLEAKSMHAMVIKVDGRFAILLGRDALYPAPVAFTLAHELGHVMLNHLADAPALVDVEDPALGGERDEQEVGADQFALGLLTGSENPPIETSVEHFNAPTLAAAVLEAGARHQIEPGTLALCLAYQRKNWAVAMASLKFIYNERKPVWREVNGIADRELRWDALGDESAQYLRNIMTGSDD